MCWLLDRGVHMTSWFKRAFGYGLGLAAGRAIFGDDRAKSPDAPREPIRPKTEEEILADEKRFDEDARRYEAEDRKRKTST